MVCPLGFEPRSQRLRAARTGPLCYGRIPVIWRTNRGTIPAGDYLQMHRPQASYRARSAVAPTPWSRSNGRDSGDRTRVCGLKVHWPNQLADTPIIGAPCRNQTYRTLRVKQVTSSAVITGLKSRQRSQRHSRESNASSRWSPACYLTLMARTETWTGRPRPFPGGSLKSARCAIFRMAFFIVIS